MTKDESDYRNLLITTQHHLNDSYDKLVVTISGGALALSIAFLKDVVSLETAKYLWLLLFSWGFFILSLASIFCEILFGIEAYKKALKQFDGNSNKNEKVGGLSSILTNWSGKMAAITLILGLSFIAVFTYFNLGDLDDAGSRTTTGTEQSTTQ